MSYNAKVYRKQGGNELIVASGGTLEVQSGGTLSLTDAIASAGSLVSTSPTAGMGYATGAGGAVTQITDATTAVTLDKVTGAITTVAQNIAAAGEVQFTVNNSTVAATDLVVVNVKSGSTGGTTVASVTAVGAGSFQITLTNLHASVAESGTLVLNFAVIKGVAA